MARFAPVIGQGHQEAGRVALLLLLDSAQMNKPLLHGSPWMELIEEDFGFFASGKGEEEAELNFSRSKARMALVDTKS